jgi:hypothetical protein
MASLPTARPERHAAGVRPILSRLLRPWSGGRPCFTPPATSRHPSRAPIDLVKHTDWLVWYYLIQVRDFDASID